MFRKSIEKGLWPIVVVNKIDRATSNVDFVIDTVENMICEFAQDESLLESPFIFSSAIQNYCYEGL